MPSRNDQAAKERRRERATLRSAGQPVASVPATITEAKSFEELISVIRRGTGLQGSNRFFSPQELVVIVNAVRGGKLRVTELTRTANLRDTVARLLRDRTAKELKQDADRKHTAAKKQRAKSP